MSCVLGLDLDASLGRVATAAVVFSIVSCAPTVEPRAVTEYYRTPWRVAPKLASKVWPSVSDWNVVLLGPSSVAPACWAVHSTRQGSATNGAFIISISKADTRLRIAYRGVPVRPGPALALSIDGVKLADLPVLDQDVGSDGTNTITADLPGHIFADVLLPGLIGGNTIQADVAGRRFTETTGHFDRAARQVAECANMVQSMAGSGAKATQ